MKEFNHLLLPQSSSPAQFAATWVRVEGKDRWLLSKNGDIAMYKGDNFSRGEYNEQFWFDFEYEAWYAMVEYYHRHNEPFPYKSHITNNFVPPGLHKKLLGLYGEDNIWWVK